MARPTIRLHHIPVLAVALSSACVLGVETDDDVLSVGAVGEDGLGGLRGMKNLFRERARPVDAWIEVDGGGLGALVL